jgi:hypothetical protein
VVGCTDWKKKSKRTIVVIASNFINLTGLTQIRLRSRPSSFGVKLDDNNNAIANYLSLYSGNAPAAYRPQLVVIYYMP